MRRSLDFKIHVNYQTIGDDMRTTHLKNVSQCALESLPHGRVWVCLPHHLLHPCTSPKMLHQTWRIPVKRWKDVLCHWSVNKSKGFSPRKKIIDLIINVKVVIKIYQKLLIISKDPLARIKRTNPIKIARLRLSCDSYCTITKSTKLLWLFCYNW